MTTQKQESEGTIIAARVRAKCNKLSAAQRKKLGEKAMKLINLQQESEVWYEVQRYMNGRWEKWGEYESLQDATKAKGDTKGRYTIDTTFRIVKITMEVVS